MWTYIHIHTHKYPNIPKHIYIYPYIPWLKTTHMKWEVNSVNHRLDIECIPSQLDSHESEMGYQLFRHNNGCPQPWWIQFGIVDVTIPLDRDSHETLRWRCLLWCPQPCQWQEVCFQEPHWSYYKLDSHSRVGWCHLLFVLRVPVVMLHLWGSISIHRQ